MKWYELLLCELRAILSNPAICLTVFGGLLFYSFLYPQPYLSQFPKKQKIAVIDNDNSTTSRKLIRMVAASSQVDIYKQALSLEQAQQMINNQEITGFLIIPENFYQDITFHRSPTLVYAADASSFLIYGAVADGITMAVSALDKAIQIERNYYQRGSVFLPTRLSTQPVFNSNMGYLNYVVPAVFLLILQQILLIATGVHSMTLKERQKSGEILYCDKTNLFLLLSIRIFSFFIIYTPFVLFYTGTCFNFYNIPRLANPLELFYIIIPFLLATIVLGTTIGSILPRKELVTLVVLVSSLPLVFTAGFIWPHELIPFWLNWLVQWAPSTHAIMASLHLNQMGERFSGIINEVNILWRLFGLYCTSAFFVMYLKSTISKEKHAEHPA